MVDEIMEITVIFHDLKVIPDGIPQLVFAGLALLFIGKAGQRLAGQVRSEIDNKIEYIFLGTDVMIESAGAHAQGRGQLPGIDIVVAFLYDLFGSYLNDMVPALVNQIGIAAECSNFSHGVQTERSVDESMLAQ
jgi:hypothetical protein